VARRWGGEVPGGLGGLQAPHPPEAQAAEAMATLISDLPRHQARLDSRLARQGGDPRGSGASASANTCLGHIRLKRSGAWWDWGQREPEARLTRGESPPSLRASVGALPAKNPPTLREKAL
jgi:hypothetical protein